MTDTRSAATTDDFARYCCGDPDCPNDCEREQQHAKSAAQTFEELRIGDESETRSALPIG